MNKVMDKEKIAIARLLVKDGKMSQEAFDTMFPELKESEDEIGFRDAM